MSYRNTHTLLRKGHTSDLDSTQEHREDKRLGAEEKEIYSEKTLLVKMSL